MATLRNAGHKMIRSRQDVQLLPCSASHSAEASCPAPAMGRFESCGGFVVKPVRVGEGC